MEAGRGNERNFASEADVVENSASFAVTALPEKQVDALRDAVLGLEKLDDAGKIVDLMVKA